MYQRLLGIRDWRILWIYFSPLSHFYPDAENMISQGHSILLILNFKPQKYILPDNWNKVQDLKCTTTTKFLLIIPKQLELHPDVVVKSKQGNCHDCICSLQLSHFFLILCAFHFWYEIECKITRMQLLPCFKLVIKTIRHLPNYHFCHKKLSPKYRRSSKFRHS